MEKKLTVKSNFYEQEDVVNVNTEEVANLINEQIQAGNIPVGTKLYKHELSPLTGMTTKVTFISLNGEDLSGKSYNYIVNFYENYGIKAMFEGYYMLDGGLKIVGNNLGSYRYLYNSTSEVFEQEVITFAFTNTVVDTVTAL